MNINLPAVIRNIESIGQYKQEQIDIIKRSMLFESGIQLQKCISCSKDFFGLPAHKHCKLCKEAQNENQPTGSNKDGDSPR